MYEDGEFEEYLNVRLIERVWEINGTQVKERMRKWIREVRRYWKRRKKGSKRKKDGGNEIEKTMKKEVLKGKIKNGELWRRKKTEIKWDYIGNEIGETERKEGKIMERERKEIEEEIGKCKLRAGGCEANWNEG